MPFNHMYISGPYMQLLVFENAGESMLWTIQVGAIKQEIDEISDDGNDDAARVPRYQEWLAGVNVFIQTWGENKLPPDIKWAVNDVERGIGAVLTVWQQPYAQFRRRGRVSAVGVR